MRAVAHALNLLADRVDELRAADREQLADLSHDLRTPITALRLDVELLGSSADRDRLVGDVERLEAAVSGLIATARHGRGATSDSGPADLAAITRARLSFWSVAAGERTRLFAVAVPSEPVWVGAAPGALTAVVDALGVERGAAHSERHRDLGVARAERPLGRARGGRRRARVPVAGGGRARRARSRGVGDGSRPRHRPPDRDRGGGPSHDRARVSLGGAVGRDAPSRRSRPGGPPPWTGEHTFATVIRPASGGPDGSAARWWVTGTRSCTATRTSPSSTAPAIPRSWWRRRTVSA